MRDLYNKTQFKKNTDKKQIEGLKNNYLQFTNELSFILKNYNTHYKKLELNLN